MPHEAPNIQPPSHSDAFQAMNADHLVQKTWEMFKVMAFWFSVFLVSVSILGDSVEEGVLIIFSISTFSTWGFYQKRWYVFARYILFLNVFIGCAFVSLQFGPESYVFFLYLPTVLAALSSFGSNQAGYGISSLFLVSAYYLKYSGLKLSFIQPVESPEEFRFLFILITMGLSYSMTTRFLKKNREFRLRLKGMLHQLQENEARLQENCRLEEIQVKQFEIANERLAEEIQNRIKAERQFSSSNEQLAQFSYAASHDLKEPLRSISGFIQLIQRKVSSIKDPIIEEQTGAIFKSSQKMTALLDDLLEYSRIGKIQGEASLVDLDKIVHALCHSSNHLKEVEMTIFQLPEVITNKKLIEQLFSNILLSAVQYTDEQRSLSITISSYKINDEKIAIRVSDNSRGIEPHNREQVFQLFNQRLSDEEVAASGVGLPICRKIVQTLGGEIWIEPNKNKQGIAYVFTLPICAEYQKESTINYSHVIQKV